MFPFVSVPDVTTAWLVVAVKIRANAINSLFMLTFLTQVYPMSKFVVKYFAALALNKFSTLLTSHVLIANLKRWLFLLIKLTL